MYIRADTEVYCIFGNPVKHSLSPLLHTYMFEYHGINAIYVAFETNYIKPALESMRFLGIKGANITVPFKSDATEFVDCLDEDAKFLETINTVRNVDGKLYGYNTDFLGFMDMFKEHIKYHDENTNIVVLGAGGASIAVVYALYKLNVEKIYLLNRTISKAEKLKTKFHQKINIEIDKLSNKKILSDADIIINTTSVGLNRNEVPINLNWVKRPVVLDIIYFDTPLVKKSKAIGLKAINGMSMFINQAYYAFKIWTGIEFNKELAKTTFEYKFS